MILQIVEYPDPILSTPAEEVTLAEIHGSEFQTLIENMKDTCLAANGAGLAANQVGVSKRMFIWRTPGTNRFSVIINPEITQRKKSVLNRGEGCLSIPGRHFKVRRYKQIVVEGLNEHGQEIVCSAGSKSQAFCIQHEMDHLDGLLLIDTGK